MCHRGSISLSGSLQRKFSSGILGGVWVMQGASLSSVVSSAGDVIRGVFWGDGALIVLSLGDR